MVHTGTSTSVLPSWATMGHKERWAHNLRSGHGVPLPELGGENSEHHCLITLGPKETGLQLEYLDAHGRVDSLALVPL